VVCELLTMDYVIELNPNLTNVSKNKTYF
jgi:hypothetical protein